METKTPRALGYRMPAEWEEHEATWLSWPKNPLTFPEEIIERVEGVFARMATALSGGEKVRILVDDGLEERARARLEATETDMARIQLLRIKSADVWIRDYGPTFLRQRAGALAAVKWRFNAWGGKYDDLLYDDITGEEVVRTAAVPVFRPGIVLEGGSIDVNGAGSVLTTEQCLLNKNRNPELTRTQIESYLREYLNVTDVIWLKGGIEGDDTDGHIDDFARFVSPTKALCAFSEDPGTQNAAVLRANYSLLRSARDQDGALLDVERLPMPAPLWLDEEKRWLPASYANFYVGNKVVLLPFFGDRNDAVAQSILTRCFPGRTVVPIDATDLVYGYGGIHCVTQQEPKGIPTTTSP
jgi:agmatine deiminase